MFCVFWEVWECLGHGAVELGCFFPLGIHYTGTWGGDVLAVKLGATSQS